MIPSSLKQSLGRWNKSGDAGAEGAFVAAGQTVGIRRENFSATAAPTSGDNFAAGWQVGSRWLYAGAEYLCTGDGEWMQMSMAGHTHPDIDSLLASLSSDLNAHTANTSNPHSVTASQVGAYTSAEVDALLADLAPLVHEHDAADITSGVLPLARGGLGGLTARAIPMGGGSGAAAVASGITKDAFSHHFYFRCWGSAPQMILRNPSGESRGVTLDLYDRSGDGAVLCATAYYEGSTLLGQTGFLQRLAREFWVQNLHPTSPLMLQTAGGKIHIRPAATNVLVASADGVSVGGSHTPLAKLHVQDSTGADHQRWAYNATHYATRRVDSSGNLHERVTGTAAFWYIGGASNYVASLSADATQAQFQLYDRSGDGAPNAFFGVRDGTTRICRIGYLNSSALYISQDHATGAIFLRTLGTGDIYLQPGLSTLFQLTADGKIGAFGVPATSRPVVPLGSSTDDVIAALQLLGWFAQS